jgi:hypothetical protein
MGSELKNVKSNGGTTTVTMTAPRPSVDPHSLVHRPKLSKTARALLGAEILDGNIPLMNLTREIVAKAVGVSAGYIDKARQLSPDQRWKVMRGERSLIERKVV